MHFLKRRLIKGRLTFLEFETSGDSLMSKLRMPQKLFHRKGMSRKLRQKPESGFCIWVEINNFANLLKASKPTKPHSLTFSGLFHLQQPPTTGHQTHEVLKVSIFLNQIRVSLLVFLPLNRRCLEMMVENQSWTHSSKIIIPRMGFYEYSLNLPVLIVKKTRLGLGRQVIGLTRNNY